MKFLVLFQSVVTLLGGVLVAWFANSAAGFSFAGGAGLTLFNFAVLVFGWPRILAKKQIALGVLTIIFKFAILGWILYLVAHSPTVRTGWFALGLATVFPSILVASFPMQAAINAEESNAST